MSSLRSWSGKPIADWPGLAGAFAHPGPGAKRQFGFGLDGTATKFGHGAASAATFHVDTERELVVIMTRNKYGKNQDKYNGLWWQAIDAGIGKP